MRIVLTVTSGPQKGRVFSFAGHDAFLIGRARECHFRMPESDEYFSRLHFLVESNAPHCRLIDMGSSNGTYVNGERVLRADLVHGDAIRAGHTILSVSIEEESPPSEPADEFRYDTFRPSVRPQPAPAWPPTIPPAKSPGCLVCATPALAPGSPVPLCPACASQANTMEQDVPGYHLVRELGRGSIGVVHLAVHLERSSPVALKRIYPTDATSADVQRFLREARILEQLNHPHIVAFLESGGSDRQMYIAMDYVAGIDGQKLVKTQGPLAVARAVRLTCQLLEALAYAHAKQFVHRDVKPGNLLLREQDGEEVLKLADFGLARAYEASQMSRLTLTSDLGGTVPYMAPEQITRFKEAKPPVDQYAAAATLYYLLTSEFILKFPGGVHEQLRLILEGRHVPVQTRRADVPVELAAIIHQGLERSPANRFPDVAAMRAALLPFGR